MRSCMDELKYLLKSKIQCIWIDTYEEGEVIKDLKEIVSDMSGMKLFTWTQTEGLKKIALTNKEKQEDADRKVNIDGIFRTISEAQDDVTKSDTGLYVLKDLHMIIDTPNIKRYIRDIKEHPSKNYNPIIVVAPIISIPIELEKLVSVIHFDKPSKEEIQRIVNKMIASMKRNNEQQNTCVIPTDDEVKKIVSALIGLTYKEIVDTMAKSIVKYKTLSLHAVMEEKIQLVEKSGVLDYTIPNVNFEEVGGNHVFKEWVEEVEQAMTEEAKEFGCQMPKGYLALGVPGTAK